MSELNAKLYFRVAFFALHLHFVSGDCIDLDLGMESGLIPDSNINASTVKNASTAAKNGRLNSGSSWCARSSESNPYLQIDLQTLHIICAVSTQGNSQADQWVKTYKLKLSTDGSTWTDYKEGGQVKFLTGNDDKNSEVKHILYEGVFARYLQFLPETHHGAVCLRTELFGVKLKPENLALGKPTTQSSTFSDAFIGSASSERAVDGNPDTNMNNKHCSQTNISNPSWWRVDLGSGYVPVSEIYIVNRFSPGDPTETSKDYEITLGSSTDVTANSKCQGRYTFIKFRASAVCFTNPLKTGRYVGIKTTKSQALQLCEVEIYLRANLAYNKQTSQSREAFGGASSRGVDGNSATSFVAGSCTYTHKEDQAWWRVDLANVEHVTEVYIVNRDFRGDRLSNFEIRVGTTSASGGVANPECGSGHSVPQGAGLSFFCHPSLYGRYVTIRSLQINEALTVCEVEVYSERGACPMQAIGVASKDAFPDRSFSASSTRSGNEAFEGRLYGGGAWSPSDNNNASDYLQIDLLYEFVICAVATQGKSTADHWTTKYKLQLSYDGSNWVIYQENSIDKVFNGNSGRDDIVKHSLKEYASARFIRFQPTTYSGHKALRVEVFGILVSRVPSQAPSGLTVVASTSTSITASWQLPPENARHGNITGFKLFYREKDSVGSLTVLTNNVTTLTGVISTLDKYTEYEFQVLAFTSKGDGPKSSVVVERTKEDAPDVPATLNHTNIAPDKSHGPKVNLTWSEPIKANGIIRNYTLFYGHEKDTQKETFGKDTLSHSVDVLGGLTYQFSVRAVTIKPGQNATLTVHIPEYEPSRGPENVAIVELNYTTFQINWDGLAEDVANGFIKLYQVRLVLNASCTPVQPVFYSTFNTTSTDVVLSSLLVCTQYEMSVRGFTAVGPGPYSKPIILQTLGVKWSKETPASLSILTNSSEDEIKVTMTLPRFHENAEFFQVIVIAFSSDFTGVVNAPESFTPQDMLTYQEAHETPGPAAYVTFQFGGNDFDKYQEFVVGDGSETNSKTRTKRSQDDNVDGRYYNKPLQRNTNYRVFLRAFVTETLYVSSNFVEIEVKDKPVVVELPHQVIISVGELALLTCEVSGDPEPSVTWTKNGNTSIPRAQFKNDGRILVIQDVSPRDSGVYECKASNKFGESRTSTTVIVAVPPSIIGDFSPSSVTCEMQTLCTLSCYATSDIPFNYSWTKNGQVPVSDGIKIKNNIIALTPRDAEIYGVYVCHATNRFGSTAFKITVAECQKGLQSTYQASTIALSSLVFVLLIVIGVLVWRLRRRLPNNKASTADKDITDNVGQARSSRARHVSDPGEYMELDPRPSEGKSPASAEYQTLQGRHQTSGYYNVGLKGENGKKEDEESYDSVENYQ